MVTRNASDDEPGPVLWWPCCPSVAPHMLPNPMWKKNEKDLCDSMFMLSIMFVSSRGQQTHHPTLYSVYMCLSYMETETERPSSCPFFSFQLITLQYSSWIIQRFNLELISFHLKERHERQQQEMLGARHRLWSSATKKSLQTYDIRHFGRLSYLVWHQVNDI